MKYPFDDDTGLTPVNNFSKGYYRCVSVADGSSAFTEGKVYICGCWSGTGYYLVSNLLELLPALGIRSKFVKVDND